MEVNASMIGTKAQFPAYVITGSTAVAVKTVGFVLE